MMDATTDVCQERGRQEVGLLDGSPAALERWEAARGSALDLGGGMEVVGLVDEEAGPCVAFFAGGRLVGTALAARALELLEASRERDGMVDVVAFRYPVGMAEELAGLTAELDAAATVLRPLLVRAWQMQRRLEQLAGDGVDWPEFEAMAGRVGLPVLAFGHVLEEGLAGPLGGMEVSDAEQAAVLLGVDVVELASEVA